MSACLIVMDDNPFLIEWLAYHYSFLPLRRLIVAIDPKSSTSPVDILKRYKDLIHVTIWNDVDYLAPKIIEKNKQNQFILYLKRQEQFYYKCMKQLKNENQTWTALIDTDEFIFPNSNAPAQYQIKDLQSTLLNMIKSPKNQNINSKTSTPCIPMYRLQMGIHESTTNNNNNNEITTNNNSLSYYYYFNTSKLVTFKYRHAQNLKRAKPLPTKSIIDLSRVSKTEIIPKNINPHRPITLHCPYPNVFWSFQKSPYIVHHYVGSLEQYLHRHQHDVREKKQDYQSQISKYKKYARYNGWQNRNSTLFWLHNFIESVGSEMALNLLEGVGEVDA